jgi:hypothetical protein
MSFGREYGYYSLWVTTKEFFFVLFGYTFGPLGIVATLVFVCIEPLIWGVGPWLISYFLYWPFVALIFYIFKKKGIKSKIIFTITALILTTCFGILTSLVDLGLFSGYTEDFFERLLIYYLRGVPFYLLQLLSNAIVFPLLFMPLYNRLEKIANNS